MGVCVRTHKYNVVAVDTELRSDDSPVISFFRIYWKTNAEFDSGDSRNKYASIL